MTTITKNKNLISITRKGKPTYYIDINTGAFLGAKGKEIKKLPVSFKELRESAKQSELSAPLIRGFLEVFSCSVMADDKTFRQKALSLHDRIGSISQLSHAPIFIPSSDLSFIEKNFSDFVKFCCKTNTYQYNFLYYYREKEAHKMFPTISPETFSKRRLYYMEVVQLAPTLTAQELAIFKYYGRENTPLFDGEVLSSYSVYLEVKTYLLDCRVLDITPRKTNRPREEFNNVRRDARNLLIDNNYSDLFSRVYAKHPSAWNFEFEDYIITIPTDRQQLTFEGQYLHHCVGTYADTIARGLCYICFVRKKDCPDTPYITCEVKTDGEIGQYFLAYDKQIKTANDKKFKKAFQNHLKEVWDA